MRFDDPLEASFIRASSTDSLHARFVNVLVVRDDRLGQRYDGVLQRLVVDFELKRSRVTSASLACALL